jgi:hypothetical protein
MVRPRTWMVRGGWVLPSKECLHQAVTVSLGDTLQAGAVRDRNREVAAVADDADALL